MRRKPIVKPSAQVATKIRVLRLYVADGAPNSVQAIANLEAICQQHCQENYQLEIVDVLDQPLRALADGAALLRSSITYYIINKFLPNNRGVPNV